MVSTEIAMYTVVDDPGTEYSSMMSRLPVIATSKLVCGRW